MANYHRQHTYQRFNGVCFYTGEKLDEQSHSLEHLIPTSTAKKRFNFNLDFNLVVCEKRINGAVGNAPIKVKFALKQHLASIEVFPNLPQHARFKIYLRLAVLFLGQYKVHNYYPWLWNGAVFPKDMPKSKQNQRRMRIRNAYMELVTDEEIQLGAYVK